MKKNLRILGRLWKVQTINYFTDPVNIILGLVLTSITMVCWLAFKKDLNSGMMTDPFVLASAIGISTIRNSQYNLNITMGSWMDKKLFATLSYTPMSRRLLAFAILSFNWVLNIIISCILFGIAMLFKEQRQILGHVEWGPFILGFILNVFLSNCMALLWGTIFKDKDWVLIISLFSYFGPMYLLGLGIPFSTTGNIEGLNIFLYLAPHRYPLAIMQAAWIGTSGNMHFPIEGNGWLANQGFGFGNQGYWLPTIITFVWMFMFAAIIIGVVRHRIYYGQRKYKHYNGIQKHLHNISEIKRAKSVQELNTLMEYINANNRKIIKKKRGKQSFKNDKEMQRIKDKRDNLSKEFD